MKQITLLAVFLLIKVNYPQFETKYTFEKVAENLNFPEGPAWDGKGKLYVSSCYGGYIARISTDETVKFIDSTSKSNMKQTNGLTINKDGNIFACDYGLGAILRISVEGTAEIFIDGYNGKPFNRPNDLAFNPKGNLYFTDPKSYGIDKLDGRIFMIDMKTKQTLLLADSLAFPNGIAFSADGNKLFVCESAKHRIITFDTDENGFLSNKNIFAELAGGDPDGIAFDSDGNLYVAHFGGQAIIVLSRNGKVINKIIVPGKKPSNIEFGGKDMKTLFITEDETNCVYSTRVEIPGLKLFHSP